MTLVLRTAQHGKELTGLGRQFKELERNLKIAIRKMFNIN
jgi:hypothetical protein